MRRVAYAVLAALAFGGSPIAAQGLAQYEMYTLPNGMRVILAEDHSAAVVTVNIWFNVGSANERLGRSGFAHLFEHMMFQGSANVGKGEHMQLVERAGGNMNGTTDEDRTAYFETMPSNRLNLALWLEADRMRSLAVTDENFENQRETVKEERRLGVDNQPYARAFTDGLTQPFDSTACFAYAHTVIGSMDDLDAAETEDVQRFFDLYYAPNNATLVLAGDFQPAEAKQLIQQYFGDLPRGNQPPSIECAVQYGTYGERAVFDDELANLPAVIAMYPIPQHKEADTRPLSLLSTILGQGESSRLNISMVREAKTALQAGAGAQSRRGYGLFLTFAIANQGTDPETLEEQLRAEVAKVVEEGVTEEELEKAKNNFRSGQIFSRQTSMGMSQALQHFAHYHDSIDEINTDLDGYMAVTVDDVKRVARTYLSDENSHIVVVVPKPAAGEEGGDR